MPTLDWRARALQLFPDVPRLAETFDQAIWPALGLWNELYLALVNCYDEQPTNDALIRRIYDFAEWCIDQPQTESSETDISSAAAVGFIENLPLDPRVSEDLSRWLSIERFQGYEALFRYLLTDAEFREFSTRFLKLSQRENPGNK